MPATKQKPQSEPEPERQLSPFYKQATSLAHHMYGVCEVSSASPHLIAIAASQMIAAALSELAEKNTQEARDVMNELAQGLVNFAGYIDEIEEETANG